MTKRFAAASAALAVLALAVAGCGTREIDRGKAESFVRGSVGAPVSSVRCPPGVKAKNGRSFDCTVVARDGRRYTVTLHIFGDAQVKLGPSDIRPAG